MLYNDPRRGINTFRRTFQKGSVGYIQHVRYKLIIDDVGYTIQNLPRHQPVGYTVFTDDIIPLKEKSHLQTTITKYLRQINKTKYIN